MKIPAYRYRCPLDRFDERADPEDIKRQGWREQHILVVSEEDARLDFVEREFVRRLGERLYGGKHHG
jgi:hypothetical protein